MPHQNGAGPDHRGDGGEAQSSVLGWLATATDSRPHNTKLQLVRADLVGADTAVAAGITATGHAPLLTLCRRLVEAGHDPSTPLEAYRGTTLCLRARSIGAGARLTVREGPDGKPRFATYRPAPDGRQSCGGQPPTRSNAGEAPAHEAQPHHQPTQKPAAVFGSTPAERFVIRHFINSIGRRPAKKIRAAFGARARQKEISHDGYIENGPRPQ
jgi:hypothetical protein